MNIPSFFEEIKANLDNNEFEMYKPKFTKEEFAEKAKPIFGKIIDAYSKCHQFDPEEEEATFDFELFTNEMEDIMFNSTDFLDLLECEITNN